MRGIVRHEASANPFLRSTERQHCSAQGLLSMSCAPWRGVARLLRPGRTGVAELKRRTADRMRKGALPDPPAACVGLIHDVGVKDQENAIDHSTDSCLADDNGLTHREINLGFYPYFPVGPLSL